MKKYILALDQGTTSSRAILFGRDGRAVSSAQHEITQIFPQEGWVEHDAEELYSTSRTAMEEAIARAGADIREVAAVGITNQRETTVLWDRHTGRAVYNAIVWQCRRTFAIVEDLKERGLSDYIRQTTGLVPDAYFSATKIKWILDNVPNLRSRAGRGDILFGTVDSWLLWRLTGGREHKTDRTNASRTMIYNINTLDWDDRLLNELQIPRAMLPEVCPSHCLFGEMEIGGFTLPVTGIAGDQQAALFGQCCFSSGDAKNTYGTGCFTLMNTGGSPVRSQNGLLTTIAAGADDNIAYALEGSVFVGGAVIQWLRDEMRFFSDSRDAEYLARKVPDTGGVYFVPAFTGIGAPYWDMYARGCIVGITRGTSREHIIRAAQESIAFQVADLVSAMERDANAPLTSLNVDGGAARDGFLMQFQADILGKSLLRPPVLETTALGAAFLAGLYTGFWSDTAELKSLLSGGDAFLPQMAEDDRAARLHRWHMAVDRSRGWAK